MSRFPKVQVFAYLGCVDKALQCCCGLLRELMSQPKVWWCSVGSQAVEKPEYTCFVRVVVEPMFFEVMHKGGRLWRWPGGAKFAIVKPQATQKCIRRQGALWVCPSPWDIVLTVQKERYDHGEKEENVAGGFQQPLSDVH